MNADEGEQDASQFMPLPPHQTTFLTELSSKFSNIDKKFEHLFEYLNQKNITEKQSNNSISNSSSKLDVLYRQISECLEQWPAKKSQNYFELKHHFELLYILRNENYKGEAVAFISKRAKKFSPLVKPLGVLLKSQLFLVICVSLVTVLTLPKFLSFRHALFDVVQDWECVVLLSDENHNKLAMKAKFNSLFASLKLNSSCFLSKKRISDCLHHFVPLNCLNLRLLKLKALNICQVKVVIWNVLAVIKNYPMICRILTWVYSRETLLQIPMIFLQIFLKNSR